MTYLHRAKSILTAACSEITLLAFLICTKGNSLSSYLDCGTAEAMLHQNSMGNMNIWPITFRVVIMFQVTWKGCKPKLADFVMNGWYIMDFTWRRTKYTMTTVSVSVFPTGSKLNQQLESESIAYILQTDFSFCTCSVNEMVSSQTVKEIQSNMTEYHSIAMTAFKLEKRKMKVYHKHFHGSIAMQRYSLRLTVRFESCRHKSEANLLATRFLSLQQCLILVTKF